MYEQLAQAPPYAASKGHSAHAALYSYISALVAVTGGVDAAIELRGINPSRADGVLAPLLLHKWLKL